MAFLILASVSFCDIDTGNKNYEISLITYLRHLKLIYLNIVLDSGYKKNDFYISTRDLNVSLVFLSLSATQWLFRSPTLILLTRSTTPGAPTSSIGLNAPDTGEHDPDLWTTVDTIPLHGNKQHSPTRHIKIKMPVCQCLYYQVLMLPAVIVVVRVGMVMAVWLSSTLHWF